MASRKLIRPLLFLATLGGLGAMAFHAVDGPQRLIIRAQPKKQAQPSESSEKQLAEERYWEIFRSGAYDRIDEAMLLQKAAYLASPLDPDLALHIAHLHLWRIAERSRLGKAMLPTITDDMVLARHYFQQAQELSPNDTRIKGWLSGTVMGEGAIHGDQRQMVEGFFLAREAAKEYPAFNLFSFAFLMSNRPHDSEPFEEAIGALFKSMEIANHGPMDRTNPTIANDLAVRIGESDERIRRAVANTWLAPHNVEGFFLVFGDLLVKKGDTRVARIIYENAKHSPDYEAWPYRDLLERRLQNLEKNVERFRAFQPTREALQQEDLIERAVIFNSRGCVICHQASQRSHS